MANYYEEIMDRRRLGLNRAAVDVDGLPGDGLAGDADDPLRLGDSRRTAPVTAEDRAYAEDPTPGVPDAP